MAFIPNNRQDPERAAREKQHRQILTATWWGIIVVAVSSIVTAWTAFIMKDQIRVMEAQQRPWLSMDFYPKDNTDSLGLYGDKNSFSILLEAKIKNSGQAVAEGVMVEAKLIGVPEAPGAEDANQIRDSQSDICNHTIKDGFISPREFGFSMFPNEERTVTVHSTLQRNDIPHGAAAFVPVVVGCVNYRFYVSDIWHQTAFSYVLRKSSEASYEDHAIKFGEEISGKDMAFDRHLWGNSFAD